MHKNLCISLVYIHIGRTCVLILRKTKTLQKYKMSVDIYTGRHNSGDFKHQQHSCDSMKLPEPFVCIHIKG